MNAQVNAMIDELLRIGVHGGSRAEIIEQLMLDQLKHLCGTSGFGPGLLNAAERAAQQRGREKRDRAIAKGKPG